jgi:hypothetical protein
VSDAFAGGHVVDAILLLMGLEFALLATLGRRAGAGLAPRALVWNFVAGACLLLALRAALVGAAWPWIAAWMLAGGVAHGADLVVRSRGGR